MWQKAKNIYHHFQGIAANVLYGFPFRGLIIIGVTGTDGKTTTANLIYHILRQAGKRVAVVSTTGAIINGKTSDTGLHITTPGRFTIQSYLRKAKNEKVHYVVLEISSHGLDQYRTLGIRFAVGIITNIVRDHLDYHKTWENYVHAKARLVMAAKVAVLNKDDKSYERIKKHELKGKDKKIITFGLKKDANINPHVFPFKTGLIGKFNQYNCLAAISALQVLQVPDEAIRKGLATFKAPVGRQEVVYDKDFKVIIDFATTGFAFTNILSEVKKLASGRIIHVFGSAAKRDIGKRPEMGRISSQYADIMIVTADDPRDEPIEKITSEIVSGVKDRSFAIVNYEKIRRQESRMSDKKKYIFTIPDRREAIFFAISLAQKGDIVLLTGKGHEQSMSYAHGEEPWSEHEVVREGIRLRGEK